MALTFDQLTQPLTADQLSVLLLNALGGVGPIAQQGAPDIQGNATAGQGTGTVNYLSGIPSATASIVVEIMSSGEPAAATFQYSIDGGATVSGVGTLPSDGAPFLIPNTGVTISFSAGPVGQGTSFVVGDTYSFELTTPNFPVTAWQAGSVPRSMLGAEASVLADQSSLMAQIAAGGILYRADGSLAATGPWLDLVGVNVYDLERNQAVATKGTVVLSDPNSAGPFTVTAGNMTGASSAGLLFTNVADFTIPKGGSVTATFEANATGAAYSVGEGQIVTIVAGNLPGVTISNTGPGWITAQGVDIEPDVAYAARCSAHWPALGTGTTDATYTLWANTASPSVTRVVVAQDPATPGQVLIFLAGPGGPSGSTDVSTVNTYIQQRVEGPLAVVVSAALTKSITIQTAVTYRSAITTLGAVQSGISTALNTIFQTALMGSDGAGTVKLYLDQIRKAILSVNGVASCDPFASPSNDTALTTGQCPVISSGSNIGTTWSGWTFTGI